MIWHLIIGKQKLYISSVSEDTLIRHEAGSHFILNFTKKIEQILSLGDEAGDCFPVYLVKSIWGREVFYSLFPEFQVNHEGCVN